MRAGWIPIAFVAFSAILLMPGALAQSSVNITDSSSGAYNGTDTDIPSAADVISTADHVRELVSYMIATYSQSGTIVLLITGFAIWWIRRHRNTARQALAAEEQLNALAAKQLELTGANHA